jgi:two-component sensor histidine kinase
MSFFCSAQNVELLFQELENDLVSNKSTKVLRSIDSIILTNTLSEKSLNELKSLKVASLVQESKLPEALKLSNSILNNPKEFSERAEVILRIQKALIFEFFSDAKLGFLEFYRLEEIYKRREKDKYYGQYLYRKSSFYMQLKPVLKSDSLAFSFAKKGAIFGDENNYKEVSGISKLLQINYVEDDKKMKLIKEALKNFKEINDFKQMSSTYIILGRILSKNKKFALTHKYLDSSIYLLEKIKDIHYKTIAYEDKFNLFEIENKPDSALVYYKKYHKARMIASLELQENEIAKIKLNNEIKNHKKEVTMSKKKLFSSQSDNKFLSFLVVGILFLLVIIFFLYRDLVLKNKKIDNQNNVLGDSVKQKELLLKELNHRVKNNLSLIISLIKFQSQEINEEFYKEKFKHLENRINTIAIAHEQFIYSEKDTISKFYNLEEYLNKISHSLIAISTRKINYTQNIERIRLDIDTALPIGILMNELISNSVEHANSIETLAINLEIKSKNKRILIFYSDSGTIFNTNSKKESLGLFIIESMINQLKGEIIREKSSYNIKLQQKF